MPCFRPEWSHANLTTLHGTVLACSSAPAHRLARSGGVLRSGAGEELYGLDDMNIVLQ